MPTYNYDVLCTDGLTRSGSSEAENAAILKRRLAEQGYKVLKMNEVKPLSRTQILLIIGVMVLAVVLIVLWVRTSP